MPAPPGRFSRAPVTTMLVVAAVLVILTALVSHLSDRSRAIAAEHFEIAHEIQDATNTLLSLLKDAETGQRGFLLTGKEEYLQPYTNAVAAIPETILRLRAASATSSEQLKRVQDLEPAISEKLRELATTVQLFRGRGIKSALEVVDTDRGKLLMDDIRSKCELLREVAERRSSEAASTGERYTARLVVVSIGGSLLLLFFLGLSAAMIFRSLTQRENLYREAAASAELLKTTLHSIGDAVIATDAEMRITFLNPVAEQLTAWSASEAVSTPIANVFKIVNETTRIPVENPLEKALLTGVVVGLANHTVLITRDGKEIPIDDSGAPIRDNQGKVVGAVLVFRDITERRLVERQLRQSNSQLQEFVSAAAHDLRSPLRSMNAMTQLIQKHLADQFRSDGAEMFKYLQDGLQRMSRLIDDLLAYAQATHFEPAENKVTLLDDTLRLALENLRFEVDSAGATITAEPLPVVGTREAHALQLFQNVVSNALKYRRECPLQVRIWAERQSFDWLIHVEDNGQGIKPQHADLIFKPFKRLHGDEVPGSGIGLATCRKIVEGYGGRIWVDSEPGKGSTFHFTLPGISEN